MHILAIVAGVIVAGVVARRLYRLMFDDSDEFLDCVRYIFIPDWWSLIRGEYFDDWMKSMKLSLFLAASGGAGVVTYMLIKEIS